MAALKNKKRKKRVSKKKKGSSLNVTRLFSFLFLLVLLAVSICTVGYVIFFRTVFAQEILPSLKSSIIFEEPNPPGHAEVAVKEDISRKPQLPKVAIIIDDMGYHELIGQKLLSLPVELTYSFLPFAPHTKTQEEVAYVAGKSILLHLPLQPKDSAWDPGPGALFLDDSPEIKKEKFKKCLREVPHAIGVNNHMGSRYTEDVPAMTLLLDEIDARSLYFVDSYTTSGSVGLSLAKQLEIKSARRHVFLDNILTEDEICKQLDLLVGVAEKNGWGIGIAHPHEVTLNAISNCVETFSSRVQFVRVEDVL
jgi:polysaccharide deacetylase 2 family uncharacterized protein YibQ